MFFTDRASRPRLSRGAVIAAALALMALLAFSADAKAASFHTLYLFPDDLSRGATPVGSMVQDSDGALYGVAQRGGDGCAPNTCGVIYQLKPTKSGPWQQKVLHVFSDAKGAHPGNGLIMGPDGALYGTAGTGGSLGGGIVFRLAPSGKNEWTFKTLHEFDSGSTNDKYPYAKLMLGQDGALYGVSLGGNGAGTIFRLKGTGSNWAYRALYHFTDTVFPYGLIEDAKGALYSVGYQGGANNLGVLFRLSPPAKPSGAWSYRVLHHFSDAAGDAKHPVGTLVLRDGALYGQASDADGSLIFRYTLPSGFKVVYRMDPATEGHGPGPGLALDGEGMIYGVNQAGPPGHAGTVYELLPPKSGSAWRLRLLHLFTFAPDGIMPLCEPLLDARGNVYVTASEGGNSDLGGVFVYRP